eukprot:scaffold225810_cov28-Tisochrysis_lutea.AAC.2
MQYRPVEMGMGQVASPNSLTAPDSYYTVARFSCAHDVRRTFIPTSKHADLEGIREQYNVGSSLVRARPNKPKQNE